MSMTGSVSGVDLPDYCLWLPHFDIDFCLGTEFEDDDFTDKDVELLHLSDCLLSCTERSVSKSSGVL